MDKRLLIDSPERRAIAVTDFELRKVGDHLALDGYASVFNHGYDVFGGPSRGGWTETVKRGAFDATLSQKPDLHLLINHEGMPLARTKSGTLKLATDDKGLRVTAPNLDRRDPDVQRLEVKMSRGDMDEMSFAFRVKADTWNDDETERGLNEVSLHKGDVSVVNFGANDATSAQMNSLLRSLSEMSFEDALAEVRSLGDKDVLKSAHDLLGRLLREQTPKARRTHSVAEARKAMGEWERRTSIAVHHTPIVNVPWDAGTNVDHIKDGDDATMLKVFAWYDGSGDDPDHDGYPDSKSDWKFPHHMVSDSGEAGAANIDAVRNALARLTDAHIPDSDRDGVHRHLQAHLDDYHGTQNTPSD